MKSMNGIIRYGCSHDIRYGTHNDKFPQEKVCFEDEDYLIHFDGVLLNSAALKESLCCNSNQEILVQLYRQYGAQLVLHAKGLYTLLLWDKKAQTALITNDLLSKRPLYYHSTENALFYGASYYDLLDNLSRDGKAAAFRMDALEDMLRMGFLTQSKTYLENVCFLNAFESLLVDLKQHRAEIITHPMKTFATLDTEDAVIDRFDELFSDAVELQFQKNAEYGYTQYATLSGGMDSRACLLKAVELGFNQDIVCFNYAQSGSLDFSISQQIAADLGLDYLHYPMDAAVFLGRLQEAMDGNECMQSGIGTTGARTMANLLNTSNIGLISIGICGGELMGDLIQRERKGEPANKYLRYALRTVHKCKELLHPENLPDGDFLFDLREYLNHLRASKNFVTMFLDKCECVSPFMDEDVAMFVLQLDPVLLYNRRMYRKWMIKYLPNSYIITSSCARIDSSLPEELLAKLRYRVLSTRNGVSQWSMNPIQHWFECCPRHADNCTGEYLDNCRWLQQNGCSDEILSAMEARWGNSWVQRLYVLTAQRAVKDVLSRFHSRN